MFLADFMRRYKKDKPDIDGMAKWITTNFIKKCNDANVKPGINVYVNNTDSGWGTDPISVWGNVGKLINKLNIKYLVFDAEDCQCGPIDNSIRQNLKLNDSNVKMFTSKSVNL